MKPSKFADIKPKKKCGRSKPRRTRCPLVLNKVQKAELVGLRGKKLEGLQAARKT